MQRTLVVVAWLFVVGLSSWLRFHGLDERPFHADEGTGARIAGMRMAGEGGQFDPKHYHGPVLHDLAVVTCHMRGEPGWAEMTKETLRLVPAVAGVMVVLLPLCWRRRMGDWPCLAAGAFLATSPLLVYYSRMFIHEMLLTLAGGLVLACFARTRWQPVLVGCALGLMFSVKETVAISGLAWIAAWLVTCACQRGGERFWHRVFPGGWKPLLVIGGTAAVVSTVFYTHYFQHPRGIWDALSTFFVYETVAGHDKPWFWYFSWLGMPHRAAGTWWIECIVLWVAVLWFMASWLPGTGPARQWVRFLGFSALGHAVLYSCFGYKTPWLACLPWFHVCLLAGFGCAMIPPGRRIACGVACLASLVPCVFLAPLAIRSAGRLASDGRNPYAYVPTRPDVERLAEFMGKLRSTAGAEEVAVVGSDYWPLPWYLRGFARVGYWRVPPESLKGASLVLAMPDAEGSVAPMLAGSHVALPRGLRQGVPIWLFVRSDVWAKWMEVDS